MDTDMLRDESTAPADIPGLVAQARAAYQQNRIKECLALTKAALLVDPGNTAALEMQSAVRFDMQRDLSDARALIEESRNKPEAQKYRKAAEIILLKALYLDPDSEGAKTLLSSIRSASDVPVTATTTPAAPAPPAPQAPVPSAVYTAPYESPRPAPPAPPAPPTPPPPVRQATPIVFAPPVAHEPPTVYEEPELEEPPAVFTPHVSRKPIDEYEPPVAFEPPAVHATPVARAETIASAFVMQPGVSTTEPIPFTVGTSYIEKPGYMKSGNRKESRSNLMVAIIVLAIAIIGGGIFLAKQKMGTNASASTASDGTPKIQEQRPVQTGSSQSPAVPLPSANVSSTANAIPPNTKLAAVNLPPAIPDTPPAAAVPVKTNTPTAPATGSLAVSSAIAAEIYISGKQVGSTPTTLQLPAGNQTVEYRHGDLRAVVTHAIKSKETTTALVVFDTIVQLQARPWATVSIEGSPRVQLGTTPLSDVRLPVGSVLVFENPNFPSKSHKIGPDDKTIQMAFP